MKVKTPTPDAKATQSAIKSPTRDASLNKSDQTTQTQGHLNATNKRNQGKRSATRAAKHSPLTRKLAKLLLPALLLLASPICAQQGEPSNTPDEGDVRGVNPADNLTKFEILPRFTMLDASNDMSISNVVLKYDRAFEGIYGLNFELPLGYFASNFAEETGIGDLNVRGRVQFRAGRWTFITGLESVLPTATADPLGDGKYQLNPSLLSVYAFSKQTFAALVAKHMFTIAGDAERNDITRGQYRIIMAHTTPDGWWFLADPQLWVDYDNGGRMHFAPEVEVGRMISKTTGIWLRGGAHLAGEWKKDDWNISAGIRFISF